MRLPKGEWIDELHAARLVEEALENDRFLRRQAAERRSGGAKIFDELPGCGRADANLFGQPAARGLSRWIAAQACGEIGAQARNRDAKARRCDQALRPAKRE